MVARLNVGQGAWIFDGAFLCGAEVSATIFRPTRSVMITRRTVAIAWVLFDRAAGLSAGVLLQLGTPGGSPAAGRMPRPHKAGY